MSSEMWIMLGMLGFAELLTVVLGATDSLFCDWKDMVKAMIICAVAFTTVAMISMCFAKGCGKM